MSVDLSEIAKVLEQKIKKFDNTAEFKEVGTVMSVGDGIARVYGL